MILEVLFFRVPTHLSDLSSSLGSAAFSPSVRSCSATSGLLTTSKNIIKPQRKTPPLKLYSSLQFVSSKRLHTHFLYSLFKAISFLHILSDSNQMELVALMLHVVRDNVYGTTRMSQRQSAVGRGSTERRVAFMRKEAIWRLALGFECCA